MDKKKLPWLIVALFLIAATQSSGKVYSGASIGNFAYTESASSRPGFVKFTWEGDATNDTVKPANIEIKIQVFGEKKNLVLEISHFTGVVDRFGTIHIKEECELIGVEWKKSKTMMVKAEASSWDGPSYVIHWEDKEDARAKVEALSKINKARIADIGAKLDVLKIQDDIERRGSNARDAERQDDKVRDAKREASKLNSEMNDLGAEYNAKVDMFNALCTGKMSENQWRFNRCDKMKSDLQSTKRDLDRAERSANRADRELQKAREQ